MEIYILNSIKAQYDDLTKGFKKIADFILENFTQIPFLSIKEISEIIGTSSATVIRFTQFFGYKGYLEFQKDIQKILKKEISPMKEFKESILQSEREESLLDEIIKEDIGILKKLSNENLKENLNKALEILKTSGTIYIVSSRSSYSLGYYFYFMLKEFKKNVELISSGTEDYTHKLLYLKENDILFAISFHAYTEFTYKITQYFKKRNNRIISLTDSLSSPFSLISDCILINKRSEKSYSFVGAITILNTLCVSLGKIDKEETLKKLEKLNEIAMELKVYL